MNRSINTLTDRTFDVLVIGGGIHGAVTAWDAALRGLSVALIERGDFGGATSQNSLKIIHGGLRYLQDGNLPRIRKMAYERTTWMKIAPHLVHPLPCLMPTRKKLARSRLAMGVALTLNDILSYDRNRLPDKEKHLPGGKIISARRCAELLPGYDTTAITGAALWHDGQIFNSERLLLEFILSAAHEGAVVANYVEATGFIKQGQEVTGVRARDCLSGKAIEVHAKVVVNSAGAWFEKLINQAELKSETVASVALNLVVDKVWSGHAAALSSQPGPGKPSQVLLIVPWRSKSLIGTWHIPWKDAPDEFRLQTSTVQEFIHEINTAHPGLDLSLADVQHIMWGFLPVKRKDAQGNRVRLMRDDQLIDHQKQDGVGGLISVVSVKYTTARVTAEKAVDLAEQKLGKAVKPCKTHTIPVEGGQIDDFQAFLKQALAEQPKELDASIVEHLVYTYGSKYPTIRKYLSEQPAWAQQVDPSSPVIAAEIIHSVRAEMAQTLTDIIQRRTELGAAGLPALPVLQKCAQLAASELGWSASRQQQEIELTIQKYPIHAMESVMA